MPELPEVETIRRGLEPVLVGRVLQQVQVRRRDLRQPIAKDFVRRVKGKRVRALTRRAKYLLIHLDDGAVVIVHLGMSGRLIAGPSGKPHGTHDHVLLTTDAGRVVRFNDARRFGLVALAREETLGEHKLLAALGSEPLGNAFSGPVLAEALRAKRGPIKAALLDQRVLAGIGNIYACEALHRAGISPRRRAGSVQGKRAEMLAQALRSVLGEAIEAGGSSLRDFRQADGGEGYFQHQFSVYGRAGESCRARDCGRGTVKRIVQSGRSTFYCPACQR